MTQVTYGQKGVCPGPCTFIRKSYDLISAVRQFLPGFAYDFFSVCDFYWNLFFVLLSGSGTLLFHNTPDLAAYSTYDPNAFF